MDQKPIISLNDVTFAYPNSVDQPVLTISNWTVASGERLFVHGPSGGGKSTLLSLISGMLFPTQGEISVLEQRLDQMSQRQRDRFRAQHIGYIFQQFNLLPYLNAVENIQLAAHMSQHSQSTSVQQDIEALLNLLSLAPDDWRKRVDQLSIGQRQRVAIARALINKPELLIADEPTSSLDRHNRDNFMSLLMSLAIEYQMTLVFVSHDMSLSHYFNRIDALSDINCGSHACGET